MTDRPPANGKCKGMPVDWFFPLPKQTTLTPENKLALKACSECDVRKECLDYALKYEHFGIWGGTTEHDRRYSRSKLRIKAQRPGGPLNRNWVNIS